MNETQIIALGEDATRLQENPALQQCLNDMREAAMQALVASPPEEIEQLVLLKRRLQTLDWFEQQVQVYIDDALLAKEETELADS